MFYYCYNNYCVLHTLANNIMYIIGILIGAITDGRFTVGITMLDRILEKRHESSEQEVKQKVIHGITELTGCTMSPNAVILLCSEWALVGSSLASCLNGGPQKQLEKKIEMALSILDTNHFLLNEAFGQGEDVKEALRQRYVPAELVQMLEDISGIAALKERYI